MSSSPVDLYSQFKTFNISAGNVGESLVELISAMMF